MRTFKRKLSGNKGFTLAELLVVIAILAILIAIAVPVFSGMAAGANLRVNQANVRSVRSAGVAHILTNLDEDDDRGDIGGAALKLNKGLDPGNCWVAYAAVNNSGDVSDLKVFVSHKITGGSTYNGIYTRQPDFPKWAAPGEAYEGFYAMSDDVTSGFATLKPSSGSDGAEKVYWVQAEITDLDPAE